MVTRLAGSLRSWSSSAVLLPIHRLESAITAALSADLSTKGFAVIDGVFGSTGATRLREEIEGLRHHMHPNCTHLVEPTGGRNLVAKWHINEADLKAPGPHLEIAPLASLLQADSTLRVMLGMHLPHLRLASQAIKLQWNQGK